MSNEDPVTASGASPDSVPQPFIPWLTVFYSLHEGAGLGPIQLCWAMAEKARGDLQSLANDTIVEQEQSQGNFEFSYTLIGFALNDSRVQIDLFNEGGPRPETVEPLKAVNSCLIRFNPEG